MKKIVLAFLTVALTMPAPAVAATVSGGASIVYTAAPGEENALQIDFDGGALLLSEAVGVPMTASGSCVEGLFETVECPVLPTQVDLGDGNDSFQGGPTGDTVSGGPGDDSLWGFHGNDTLAGGEGNDSLEGTEPSGPVLEPNGADVLIGGPGFDRAGYGNPFGGEGRSGGTMISLDGLANDGAPGEGDNFASDLEHLVGGAGPDTIVGDEAANQIDGGFGNDTLSGRGGNDTLDGAPGDDQLNGESGDDSIEGGEGHDAVDGGSGMDALFGDNAECLFADCGTGNDRIQARDGVADTVGCGLGADVATVDGIDNVLPFPQACETVDRQTATSPNVKQPQKVKSGKGRQSLGEALRKGLKVAVKCPARCSIRVTALVDRPTARRYRIAKSKTTAARGSGALKKKGTKTVRAKFTRKAKKGLAKAKRVKLTVKVRTKVGKRSKTATRKMTLKR